MVPVGGKDVSARVARASETESRAKRDERRVYIPCVHRAVRSGAARAVSVLCREKSYSPALKSKVRHLYRVISV